MTWAPNLEAALQAVPLPPGIVSEDYGATGNVDGALSIYSPSGDTLYDLYYGASKDMTKPYWGGVVYNASQAMGAYPKTPTYVRGESWGASASGLISQCGIMTWDEWTKHHAFSHAIGIASWGAQQAFVYPAWKGDGASTQNANAIPHGTICRFDPALDLSADDSWGACNRLGLSPFAAAMARAIQTFGLVFHDGAGTVNCFAEDITLNSPSPGAWWTAQGFGYGSGSSPNATTNDNVIMTQLFSATMRSHLQVLSPAWMQAQALGG